MSDNSEPNMPYFCIVHNCTSFAKTKAELTNITFYNFPEDQKFADLWVKAIGQKGINVKYARICSLHFTEDDIGHIKHEVYKTHVDSKLLITTKRLLIPDAVPSKNLTGAPNKCSDFIGTPAKKIITCSIPGPSWISCSCYDDTVENYTSPPGVTQDKAKSKDDIILSKYSTNMGGSPPSIHSHKTQFKTKPSTVPRTSVSSTYNMIDLAPDFDIIKKPKSVSSVNIQKPTPKEDKNQSSFNLIIKGKNFHIAEQQGVSRKNSTLSTYDKEKLTIANHNPKNNSVPSKGLPSREKEKIAVVKKSFWWRRPDDDDITLIKNVPTNIPVPSKFLPIVLIKPLSYDKYLRELTRGSATEQSVSRRETKIKNQETKDNHNIGKTQHAAAKLSVSPKHDSRQHKDNDATSKQRKREEKTISSVKEMSKDSPVRKDSETKMKQRNPKRKREDTKILPSKQNVSGKHDSKRHKDNDATCKQRKREEENISSVKKIRKDGDQTKIKNEDKHKNNDATCKQRKGEEETISSVKQMSKNSPLRKDSETRMEQPNPKRNREDTKISPSKQNFPRPRKISTEHKVNDVNMKEPEFNRKRDSSAKQSVSRKSSTIQKCTNVILKPAIPINNLVPSTLSKEQSNRKREYKKILPQSIDDDNIMTKIPIRRRSAFNYSNMPPKQVYRRTTTAGQRVSQEDSTSTDDDDDEEITQSTYTPKRLFKRISNTIHTPPREKSATSDDDKRKDISVASMPAVPNSQKMKRISAVSQRGDVNLTTIQMVERNETAATSTENANSILDMVYLRKLESAIKTVFTSCQIKKLMNPNQRINWAFEDISNCICLHSVSPQAYMYLLTKNYPLPKASILSMWATKIDIWPKDTIED